MSIKQAIEALEELVEYAEEAGFDWSLDNARAALAALRSMPQGEQRPQNCGTGFCSCIECPYETKQPTPTDCAGEHF